MMLIPRAVTCFILVTVASTTSSDNCDWSGSGSLQMSLIRGVQPVYLRCNQGTIHWQYPMGALRIVLQHRTALGDFSACVRRTNSSSGARIYLASKKRLHPVFRLEDPPDIVRCVTGNPVVLYVEADPLADVLNRETMEFSYHLKKTVKRAERSYVNDCEPCTEDQLLRHYCTSDFVIQGIVTNLYHNRELGISELTVRVTELHRTNGLNELIVPHDFSTSSGSVPPQYVILHRALNCGTKAGTGEYLFLGKWELRNPVLYCIPRVAEWKKVRRKAVESGMNECLL